MLVRILKPYRYYLDHVMYEADEGETLDLPDHRAHSCIAAGYGKRESTRGPVAAPMTKPAEPEIAKADEPAEDEEPETQPNDFTVLPKIGEKNAQAIQAEGVHTFQQLFEMLQHDTGKQFLIALPRIQPKHLPEIEEALMAILLGSGDE